MNILELAQPYIVTILQAILALLAAVVVGVIYQLRSKVETWLEARTSAAQREELHKLAAEGYATFEKQMKDKGGEEKLEAAVSYVLQRWKVDAVGIDYDAVKAAVQKAWVELDAKNRGAA